MIQKYTNKTASENRCDEVEDRWDESVDWCENKKNDQVAVLDLQGLI
jgi:hypothetical protein